MFFKALLTAGFYFAASPSPMSHAAPPVQRTDAAVSSWVRPLIGTKATRKGYGGTIPAVTRPFGMTHWTPATRVGAVGKLPYWWHDKSIIGFKGMHQPAPWMGDYGYVSLMPGVGTVTPGKSLPFLHAEETARIGRYDVRLVDQGKPIDVSVTATERVGFMRFDFPQDEHSVHVVLEAIHSETFLGGVEIDPRRREISGFNTDRHSHPLGPALTNFRGYFVARFLQPFTSFGTWDTTGLQPDKRKQQGNTMGGYVGFSPGTRRVHVKVGTSFISVEQARKNLDTEIASWNFDKVVRDTQGIWNEQLGRLKVEGGTENDRVRFYTALYRTMLFPRNMTESGRYASGADDQVHKGSGYNDYSLWDTFRAEHPLLTLTAPERVDGMVQSLLQIFDQAGRLPLWPNPMETNIMIGTHADCVIADALVKGFRGFDSEKAWQAVKKNAYEPPVGDEEHRFEDRMPWFAGPAPTGGTGVEARAGLTWYRKLGFVPYDKTAESVSRTVEYSIDDFCAAEVAKHVGDKAEDELRTGSTNWRNVFPDKQQTPVPRHSSGAWFDGKYPWQNDAEKGHPGFTEGGAWTYTFGAMHDVAGMVQRSGGADNFLKHLDENFDGGHHDHNNEPGHHFPYLYALAGKPARTEARVRQIMNDHYQADEGGLFGDDDCGQMSAWFVFGALGFYPAEPASGRYTLGTPLFTRATLKLGRPYKKGTLTIIAPNLSAENHWVQSVKLNGKTLPGSVVAHHDLVSGNAVLLFEMGNKPRD